MNYRNEADEWGTEAPIIRSPGCLAAIREVMEQSPIIVGRYDGLCQDDNVLTHGKCPDTDGLVPKRGAY